MGRFGVPPVASTTDGSAWRVATSIVGIGTRLPRGMVRSVLPGFQQKKARGFGRLGRLDPRAFLFLEILSRVPREARIGYLRFPTATCQRVRTAVDGRANRRGIRGKILADQCLLVRLVVATPTEQPVDILEAPG